jgi:GNAT superfamily N-acetyltransferase
VFVEPEHRRKGLAKRLMALAEEGGRELGVCYAILHSTRQGRALYESLGWGPTSEMAIRWEQGATPTSTYIWRSGDGFRFRLRS